jgi:prolyl oligopeptidase
MKKIKLMFVMLLCAALTKGQLQYPSTKKTDQTDNYHGITVADPYRWLEDDNSAETKDWVMAQNKVTQDYLAAIPFREKIKNRLTALWNYPRQSAPFKEGDWYYYTRNTGLQNQSVWYRKKGLAGTPEVFVDPNTLSADGTVSFGGMSFSRSGKYMAYMLQQSGSDWQDGYVMEAATGKKLTDHLKWLKFTGFSWKGEDGFYYSRYPEPKAGESLKGVNLYPKVYYHKMGTEQKDDRLVYEDNAHPQRFAGAYLTEDERFLILSTSEGTSGDEIWVRDLKNPAQKDFTLLVPGFETEAGVVDNVGDKILLRTNDGAPNFKVVLVDPLKPGKENWKTVIAEQPEVLISVGTGGGCLFANYLKDASTRINQFGYDGKLVRSIRLPGIGSAGGFGAKKKDKEFFYSFSSFNYPPTIFKYDIKTGVSSQYQKAEVAFDPSQFEVKQLFFNSKDGTRVPMFITYKKGLQLNGSNPVLIYGYGGFNAPTLPSFSASNIVFLEQGGIYAVVNLRGGNEYGENWHKGGMLGNKQNVFDDFIGAAEYLVAEKYTSKGKIAIRGGSNGGLLVGACMTQRPDLFKVALPAVGVMDMLRYHKFTIGYAWAVEYGSSDKAEQFTWLYKYSPLHNLKPGTAYPATLVTTADHDDRVVPAHSFKFAATLQECHKGDNPVIIRIESKAGHGAGKPTSKQIEESADIWSFTMYNLGMSYQ